MNQMIFKCQLAANIFNKNNIYNIMFFIIFIQDVNKNVVKYYSSKNYNYPLSQSVVLFFYDNPKLNTTTLMLTVGFGNMQSFQGQMNTSAAYAIETGYYHVADGVVHVQASKISGAPAN
jgi:hypothetical protein